MATAQELANEIEKLPPVERAALVDQVLRDVLQADSAIEAAWMEEAGRRWDAYTRGELQAVPYDEAMAKYQKP